MNRGKEAGKPEVPGGPVDRYEARKSRRKPGEVHQGQIIKGLNPDHPSVPPALACHL